MIRPWLSVLTGCAALAACSSDSSTLAVAGTVEIREVRIAPLSPGRLLRLLKDEGDTVHRGDTVAVLEQPGLDALIAQQRARSEAATARTAEIQAAEADSQRAARDVARARPLRESGVLAPQQFETLQSAAAAAAARLQAVRAAARESQAARAGLAAIESTRDQLTLISPEDGIVLTRFAERGEAVTAGMPVLSIGLVSRPWIRAYVGERFLARVAVGQPVAVRTDAYADSAFTGRVVEISSRAEFTPRAALTERERADLVFAIKVQVDDPRGRLKAGLPVDLAITLLP
ncbi:MAG TPA: efflux RND transporter periplasmic adaptor subunit [Gemmatimonadales bacterium]|nr:efflux RND transporter periplasmic adaptor subunit [Gemmatimonadales bacterium]